MKKLSKPVIITIVTLLTIGVVAALFVVLNKTDQDPTAVNVIDYSGPTNDEKSAGDEQKAKNQLRQETDNNPTPPSTAQVVVVDAGQYENIVEVRAYVANVYENGGRCSLTLVNGDETISRTSEAFKDATTTQCGVLEVPRSELNQPGAWRATVTYNSPTITGSASAELNIR